MASLFDGVGHALNLEEIIINRLGKEARVKQNEGRICSVVERVGVCGLVFLADELMPPLAEVIGSIRHLT